MIIKKSAGKGKSLFSGKKIITFDTETLRYEQPGKNGLVEIQKLGYYSVYDGENYYNGLSKFEFLNHIKILLTKYNKIIMVAHNMKFDLQALGLINDFVSGKDFMGMEQKKCMLDGVFYIQYKVKKKSLEFLDSFNFFKAKLKDIAKDFGEKNYKDDDYSLSAKQWTNKIKKEIENKDFSGAGQDSYLLYQLMQHMQENKNISWGLSSASSAFRTWKNEYNNYDINIPEKMNYIFLQLYRGGRNELYSNNEYNDIIDVDINSLYPYVMKYFKYSIKLKKKLNVNKISIDYLLTSIKEQTYNYIFNVDFYLKGKRNPVMLKSKSGKLMQFQEGKNIWITGQEFYYLHEVAIVKINECYQLYNGDLFSGYVDKFYEYKKNSGGVEKQFYKLMLNSLYGKFGQHKKIKHFTNYEELGEIGIILKNAYNQGKSYMKVNEVNYSLYPEFCVFSEDKESKYPILIAAEITANARLTNYIKQRELGFDNVIYTDTDSFFCKRNEKTTEIINKYLGEEIGMWKVENEGKFIGYACKNYEFIDNNGKIHRKLKGVKKNAVKLNENEYEQDIIKPINTISGKIISVYKIRKKDNKLNDKFNHNEIWKNDDEYMLYIKYKRIR